MADWRPDYRRNITPISTMDPPPNQPTGPADAPQLRRSLNLPLLVLYGLGTTIGAGIYVLVGAAAGRAGMYAPIAFVIAAIGIAPTAISFSEFAARYPVSAGEAAFVRAGFGSRWLATATGWLVILTGLVASATIANGAAGYMQSFVDMPTPLLVIAVVLVMGGVAAWGILESVLMAALFTLIEAGGLVGLIVLAISSDPEIVLRFPDMLPPLNVPAIWIGISSAGLLAIFAFIGFEDIVNVAEETKSPRTTVPWAIFLTLAVTALLYTLVAAVSVLSVPPEDLAQSGAPLVLVYQSLTDASPAVLIAIAIFATLNTILIQFIMATRVVYGLAVARSMPGLFTRINSTTRTPLAATAAIVSATLVLALLFPLERLAETTSLIILFVWVLTNSALIRVKLRGDPAPAGAFTAPLWIPVCGLLFCVFMLGAAIVG